MTLTRTAYRPKILYLDGDREYQADFISFHSDIFDIFPISDVSSLNSAVTEPFDAIFTDISIGNKHGDSLIGVLSSLFPGKPIFVISAGSVRGEGFNPQVFGHFVKNGRSHEQKNRIYAGVQRALSGGGTCGAGRFRKNGLIRKRAGIEPGQRQNEESTAEAELKFSRMEKVLARMERTLADYDHLFAYEIKNVLEKIRDYLVAVGESGELSESDRRLMALQSEKFVSYIDHLLEFEPVSRQKEKVKRY